MRTTCISVLTAVAMVSLTTATVRATLIGTQVTGALYFVGYPQNWFDSANGRVPSGYLNVAGTTVTIASNAVEFGYAESTAMITADFTGAGLTVTDTPLLSGNYNPIRLVFTNSAFSTLSTVSDTFPNGGMTASLSGDVITLSWAGGVVTSGESLQVVFAVNAPLLSILLTSANTVAISWPAPSPGFALQHKSSLSSTNWVNVTNTPTVANGRNQVLVSPPAGTQFYRLKFQ